MRRATVADVSTERPDWREFLGLDDAALLRQCDFDRFRASGPGGQKRNVTDSAVRLRHRPSGVSAEAHESRSQHENRARALRRLRHSIALQLRAPVTLEDYTPARELAAARTKDRRLVLGRRDARYRAALASLFDILAAAQWRPSEAARTLRVTNASLTRFIEADRVAWRALNERRREHGLSSLRGR